MLAAIFLYYHLCLPAFCTGSHAQFMLRLCLWLNVSDVSSVCVCVCAQPPVAASRAYVSTTKRAGKRREKEKEESLFHWSMNTWRCWRNREEKHSHRAAYEPEKKLERFQRTAQHRVPLDQLNLTQLTANPINRFRWRERERERLTGRIGR